MASVASQEIGTTEKAAATATSSPSTTQIDQDIKSLSGGEVLSRKELWAWYLYGVATEPFNTSIIGLYMSTALNLMAAMEGYELDHETKCDYNAKNYKCDYKWAGRWIDTASFPLYITTIASLIQAVMYISMGTLADHSKNRKRMMFAFVILGCASCICLLGVRRSSLINTAAALYTLGCIGYGCSLVFYYAYIPLISRAHPRTVYRKLIEKHGKIDIPEILAASKLAKPKKLQRDERYMPHVVEEFVTNRVSALGNLWMNLAAVVVLGIGVGILAAMSDQLYGLIVGSAVVGCWWLIHSVFPYLFLKDRPGPPLPEGTSMWLFPFKSFKQTCTDVSRLPETLKFLIGWFLLADGMNTAMNITSLFAQTVLGMDESLLAIAVLIAPIFSMIGAFGFSWIQERYNIRTRTLIVVVCFLSSLLIAYIMIGFGTTGWGLNHPAELYPLIAVFGVVNGGAIALTRAQFVELCPPGMEAEMFSLFRVTDKGSAFIGPLVAAGINTATHNLRYAYVWCLALFCTSGLFFFWSNTAKGREQAQAMSRLGGHDDDAIQNRAKAYL
ncbi:Autophagy protein 22 [Dipsacomyces acuminosporus]|nr:Autophagy protein 22 [Dipsacomyces acuminosporus]